ncbi:DHA2 family efflux MFS transporter permease subunit [Sporolactobacillus laevolacticus]|uniref:DHA2 family efflux MFS transporter permease subunit n=1 Tax=Sporolactobacillus laevolacticus TaxID=33018 RepID=UPI0025B4709B|nr:DHA2 family efflux MFS transporter permease subunit [Sporolactobacillus laevolacticus]MDN3955583.1 DHA2 family efflux MFS transporter permease subunit [Sporolactobacillus laevolacticus]
MSQELDRNTIKKGPLLFIMILGAFIAILNQTIMSVAIPELITELNIAATTAQWLTTGYMLVNGVFIPVTAYLMQRFTTRELFLSAMIAFLAGTIVSGVAPGFEMLLIGRLIQAAGAGIIMPLLMNVVLAIFPVQKRGGAMGLIGVAIIFAPAIGPTYAGYMLDHFVWRSLFYVIIPFAALVIILAFFYLKNVTERTYPKLDVTGMILSTVGFGTLLYGFSRAGAIGWSSAEVILTLIIGVIALVVFSISQLRNSSPLLDLKAFKYNMFALTTVVNVVVTVVMYADMMLLPIYLQNMRHYSAFDAGILMLPGALLMGLMMPVAGRLFDRFGAKWLSIIGIAITVVTTISFTSLTDSTSYTFLLLMSTVRRFGMALFLMPITTAGLNQLPTALHAHGNAISNTVKQVSGAIGTALLVTILTNRAHAHAVKLAAEGTISNPTKLLLQASIAGMNDAYLAVIIFGLIGLAMSFFIKKTKQADLVQQGN